ncbi:MAG: ABC transporter permease subunit [Nanoarchaeota archaeon]|nr:ABC transporter permease subunit [Nanoarchaeota archaeon]MBU1945805.1 ABC transporter permease subunit [Nanoarchaeota archaeon]
MKKNVFILISLISIFVFWQFIEDLINIERVGAGQVSLGAFIPTPLTIATVISAQSRLLFSALSVTLLRAIIGFLFALLFAILNNYIFIAFPKARQFFLPIMLAVNSFPIIGFSPLVILLFGQGSEIGIIFISFLIAYFPILITLDKALKQVSVDILDLAKLWGFSRGETFVRIQFPFALPHLFNSFKLALPASIIGATLGEWLGTSIGIGRIVVLSLYQLEPGLMYSALILITLSSLFGVFLIDLMENIACPWQRGK